MREQSHESIDQRLAANMRQLRERKGMSQSALAAEMTACGFSWHQQTVGRIESGQQPLKAVELVALADVLKTSVDRFTWSSPEANATERVYAAGTAVWESYEKIAEAIRYGLTSTVFAERILSETAGDPSPRVQEARDDTAARLKEFGVNEAIAEGAHRYNEQIGVTSEDASDE